MKSSRLLFGHALGSADIGRPKDAYKWSGGKALMATGSPFPPVEAEGSDEKYVVAECNNVSPHYVQKLIVGFGIPWSRLGHDIILKQSHD